MVVTIIATLLIMVLAMSAQVDATTGGQTIIYLDGLGSVRQLTDEVGLVEALNIRI